MTTPAHLQITNLIYRYADAIDGGRYDEIAEIYGRATVIMGGRELTGPEAAEAIRASNILYDGLPSTHHVMTNVILDFDEAGTSAKGHTKFTVFQGPPAISLQPILTGGYHDEFGSEDGSWFFTRREYYVGMKGDVSKHVQPGIL